MYTFYTLICYWLVADMFLQHHHSATEALPLPVPMGKPKFCGKALNDMLDLVCVNGFYPKIKRTRRQDLEAKVVTFNESTRRRRHRRLGIVHECCHNGCIYTDIVRYCR